MSDAPTMSREEFTRGWRLLIIQPWGWRYNQTEADGRPTYAAREQLEFYYDRLKWAAGEVWLQVAKSYAHGDEWPSLNALILSAKQVQAQYRPALTDQRPGDPMPDEVRAILERIGNKMTMVSKASE